MRRTPIGNRDRAARRTRSLRLVHPTVQYLEQRQMLSGTTTYASDLPFVKATADFYGTPQRDHSINSTPSNELPLSLRGVVYPKGIGTHANSDVQIQLDGRYDQFYAMAGVDDETNGSGSVTFQVWADGTELYDSGLVLGTSAAVPVNVDVRGKSTLDLIVTNGGDGYNYDHADWADAQLRSTAPVVGDPGFEAVSVGNGGYVYGASGSSWSFGGSSGLTGNHSGFTGGNPNAPEGSQVAFLQMTGTISQTVPAWDAGDYQISFQAAQRAGFNSPGQDFHVLIDGNVVGTFDPTSASYQKLTTSPFHVAAGAHTITFQGLDTAGGDNTAFLDAIELSPVSNVANPGTGLQASYFSNESLTGPSVNQVDPTVNFNWNGASPVAGVPGGGFSARWTGSVYAPASGQYTFTTVSDDGVRLWVDGKLLIDDWTDHPPTTDAGTITLSGGAQHSIRMEYYQGYGGSTAQLLWSGPTIPQQIIPQNDLYVPSGDGLSATYFSNMDLTGATVTRVDPTINFNWGDSAPASGIPANYFSARWTGQVMVPTDGTYTFSAIYDDGARLWVDGQLLIDDWNGGGSRQSSGSIALKAGQRYDIRMEYFQFNGPDNAQLLWSGPGIAQEVIPQANLFSSAPVVYPTAPTNLTATSAPTATEIDLNWSASPGADQYVIQRSQVGVTGWTTLGTVAGTSTSYADRTVSGLTDYAYRVQAVQSGIDSPFSNVANAFIAGDTFLQGTAYIDVNGNNQFDSGDNALTGATVQLFSADGTALLGTTTTDAHGYYRFDDSNVAGGHLRSGTFRLVETPPRGAASASAQASSNLDTSTVLGTNTIQVTLADPSNLMLTVRGIATGEAVWVGYHNQPIYTLAGQDDLALTQNGATGSDFLGFCGDLAHTVYGGNTFAVTAETTADAYGSNGGRIAYLFNHYGQNSTLTQDQATGLQLALWELENDPNVDLNSGNFLANADGVGANLVAIATAYLNESVGKNEAAVLLDATLGGQPVPQSGRQGMIVSSSFNFGNKVVPTNLFLQGTAFLDGNRNGQPDSGETDLAGVRVQLYSGDGTTLLGTTTTDANGYYRFDSTNVTGNNLQPGTYRLVETAPSGDTNTGAQALTSMGTSTVLAPNSIQVTLLDPSNLALTFNNLTTGDWTGVLYNGQATFSGAGLLNMSLDSNGTAVSSFEALCGDLLHDVYPGNTYAVLPETTTAAYGANGGRIGYLFNHYATGAALTNDQAAGLQIALWELEIDATADLNAGTFQANTGGVPQAALDAANAYLTESAGKSESAIFYDATLGGQPVPQSGRQGMIGTGSYNFGNAPPVTTATTLTSLSGFVYLDSNNDGRKNSSEDGVAGATVTLTGKTSGGSAVAATTTTNRNGAFVFDSLQPGTYSIIEQTPAGLILGKTTVGSLGGTVATGQISGITLAGKAGANYDFGMDRPPAFTSTPQPEVQYGNTYDYAAAATDPDGDPLQYKLLSGPAAATFDGATGRLIWTTTAADIGSQKVALQVADGRGGVAEQDFTIRVVDAPNHPPFFTSTPVVDAYIGVPYTYHATATDPDGDPLNFYLDPTIAGMSLPDPGPTNQAKPDPAAGVVVWTPTAAQVGLQSVKLRVYDGRGGSAEQDYEVLVHQVPGNHPPVIVSDPVRTSAPPQTYQYQVRAVDPDNDPLTYSFVDAVMPDEEGEHSTDFSFTANGMQINRQTGLITWFSPSSGVTKVSVIVSDGRGGTDQQIYYITPPGEKVVGGTGGTPGEVDFSPFPTDPADGTAGSRLLATAQSGNFPHPFVPAVIGAYGTFTPPVDGNPIFNSVDDTAGNGYPVYGQTSGFYRVPLDVPSSLDSPYLIVTANADDAGAVYLNGHLLKNKQGDSYVFYEGGDYSVSAANTGWLKPGHNELLFAVNNSGGGPTGLSFEADLLEADQHIAPKISSTPPTAAHVNDPFEYLVRVANPSGDPLTFSLAPSTAGGSVPAGMKIDPVIGLVTWTPTADQKGPQSAVVVVTNPFGQSDSQSMPIQVGVDDGTNTAPILLNRPGFAGVGAGIPFSFDAVGFDADGDPIRYSLPVAPDGMVIDPITGHLRWTPTDKETGTQDFLIRLEDGRGGVNLYPFEVFIPGVVPTPVFTTTPTSQATVGQPYVYQVGAVDADNDPITFSIDPSTPPPDGMGFLVDHPDVLAWTPDEDGTATVIIDASNGRGGVAQQIVTVTAADGGTGQAPTIVSSYRTSIPVGWKYLYQVIASNPSSAPLTYSLVNPPQGLTITQNGLVSWPTAGVALRSYAFGVTVSNAYGSFTQPVIVQVVAQGKNQLPIIDPATLPGAVVGQSYAFRLTGSDPDNDPLYWSLDSKPDGMAIDPTSGLLVWTPTADQLGSDPLTVRLTDGQGGFMTRQFAITVRGVELPPMFRPDIPPDATQHHAYSYQVQAYDPQGGPLTFKFYDPDYEDRSSLPSDLKITSSGLITWTDPTSDYQPIEVVATDDQGLSAEQDYLLRVLPQAPPAPPTIDGSKLSYSALVNTQYRSTVTATGDKGDAVTLSVLSDPSHPGMTIDQSGVITWTPTAQGSVSVTIVATDQVNNLATRLTYTIAVRAANHAPQVTPIMDQTVTLGAPFSLIAQAYDPDGDQVHWSLATAPGAANPPAGLTINPDTGEVDWTPGSLVDPAQVQLVATDPYGATGATTLTLHVVPDTTAPVVVLQASDSRVQMGQQVTFLVQASDNVAVASYSLMVDGQSVALDDRHQATVTMSHAGSIMAYATATDTSNNVGSAQPVSILVVDPNVTDVPTASIDHLQTSQAAYNGIDPQSHLPTFNPVTVAPGSTVTSTITLNDPAVVQALTATLGLLAADDSGLTVTLTSPNDTVVTLFSGLGGQNVTNATFDDSAATAIGSGSAPYSGTFRPQQALAALAGKAATGAYVLTITNHSTTAAATLTGWSLGYTKAPSSIVTAPVEVLGTASDMQQFANYTLTLISGDGTTSVPVGSGTTEVHGGVLGQIDPTMLPDGLYTLELTAYNTGGQSVTVDQAITIEGHLKLGNFQLSFTDLAVPVAGIPITITRSYDTLNANRLGDFGYGWTLDEGDFKLQISETDGSLHELGRGTPLTYGTHIVLTRPGHDPEGFTFAPIAETTGSGSLQFPTGFYKPNFVPDYGVTSTLAAPDAELIDLGNGEYSTADDATADYSPDSLTLTSRQGIQYALGTADGKLIDVTDRSGNVLTFDSTGIYSSAGRFVTFHRNGDGLIDEIDDQDGNRITYTYDSSLNLIGVNDAQSNQRHDTDGSVALTPTQFFYRTDPGAPAHYIDHIVDPLGRPAARTDYDDQGRVKKVTDASGKTTTYAWDSAGRVQQVTDQLSHTTTITLDARGNVLSTVDPKGVTTVNTYDSADHLLSQTTVVGQVDSPANGEHNDLTTSYTYTGDDRKTMTDPRGNVTYYGYNQYGQPTGLTTALGSLSSTYDETTGLLRSVQDVNKVTTSLDYNDQGNPVSVHDDQGDTLTTNAYDTFGDVTSTTPGVGVASYFDYDINGNRVATWYFNGVGAAQVQVLDLSRYVAGRVVGTLHAVLPAGQFLTTNLVTATIPAAYVTWTTRTNYTADGLVAVQIDRDGNETDSTYDRRGLLVQVRTLAAGSTVGIITRTYYDAAGQAVAVTDPYLEGTPTPQTGTMTVYDEAGRVQETDRVKGLIIDLAGTGPQLVATLTSPGTVVTKTVANYDSAGRVASTTDSGGLQTITTYDSYGETTESRTQSVDQDGKLVWLVTRTVYDAMGRPVLTTDPYVESSSDPIYATRTDYDSQGRDFRSVRLEGVVVTLAPGDHSTTVTNPGTELWHTTTVYNTRGQVAQSIAADGEITSYEYDSLGRQQATIAPPVTIGGQLVSLRTETVYGPDGRVATVYTNIRQDASGNIDRSQERGTSYTYDRNGNVILTTYADGTTTSATYDDFGRKLTETNQLHQTRTFEYDAAGRLKAVTLPTAPNPNNNGTPAQPRYEYGYDAMGNQTLIRDPLGHETRFTFDAQGNQTSRTLPLGFGPDGKQGTADDSTLPEGNFTETATYDDQGRVALKVSFEGVVTTYAYDAQTGRLSGKQFYTSYSAYNNGQGTAAETWSYTYDAFGRTVRVVQAVAGGATRVTTTAYDGEGQVASVTTPEGTVNYRYDDLGRLAEMFTGIAGAVLDDTLYGYDALGRLAGVTMVEQNGVAFAAATRPTTTYAYDLLGNLAREDLPNGDVEVFTYDALSHLKHLTEYAPDATPADLSNNPVVADYAYTLRDDGTRKGAVETFYFADSNGAAATPHQSTTTWTYDDLGRLVDEVIDSYDNTLDQHEHFIYDLTGNRLEMTLDRGNDGTVDQDTTYQYDANDRLLKETQVTGGNTASPQITTYGYDHTEQTSKDVAAGGSWLSRTTDGYDLQGQMAVVTTTSYTSGTPSDVERTTYTYGADDILVSQLNETDANADGIFETRSRVDYLNDANNATDYNQAIRTTTTDLASNSVQKVVVTTFGHDAIAQSTSTYTGSQPQTSATYIFGHDGHGSTRVLTDLTGQIATFDGARQLFTYDAYGNLLGQSTVQAATSLLYSGQMFDARSGQQYLRARWYDAATGRFSGLDTFYGDLQDPQSLHKYLYTDADPINGWDPTGESDLVSTISTIGIGLNLVSFQTNIIRAGLAAQRRNYAEATSYQLWAAVDAAFLLIPFFGPGAKGGFALAQAVGGYQTLVRIGGSLSSVGTLASTIAGYTTTLLFALSNAEFPSFGGGGEAQSNPIIESLEEGGNTLLTGEGDLSFTEAITNPNNGLNINPKNIVATDITDFGRVAPDFLKTLTDRGVRVLGNVNARDLAASFSEKFQNIVWNFPYGSRAAGQGQAQILGDFFVSARDRLNSGGQIIVSLKNGAGHISSNTLEALVKRAGLTIRRTEDFDFAGMGDLGYQHVQTATNGGKVSFGEGATTYFIGH